MMNNNTEDKNISEVFKEFSNKVNSDAEKYAFIAAANNWDKKVPNSICLTQKVKHIIDDLGKINTEILNKDRGRRTIINANLFEIFIGKLIKNFLILKFADKNIKITLDSHKNISGKNIYPDILIEKDDKVVGIIELKFTMKNKQYIW